MVDTQAITVAGPHLQVWGLKIRRAFTVVQYTLSGRVRWGMLRNTKHSLQRQDPDRSTDARESEYITKENTRG